MGAKFGAVSFLNILAPELNDRLLADFLDMDSSLVVSMHVKALDQLNAIKTVKRKLTELNATKIQEQKKAVRADTTWTYSQTTSPPTARKRKNCLQELQSRNERMFLLTFVVVNTADSLKALNNTVLQAKGIAQKHNCQLVSLDFQQEDGLDELPAAGAQPHRDTARLDHVESRYFCAVHDAGAVPAWAARSIAALMPSAATSSW